MLAVTYKSSARLGQVLVVSGLLLLLLAKVDGAKRHQTASNRQFKCGLAPLNPLGSPTRPRARNVSSSGYIINGQDQKYGHFPSFARVVIRARSYVQTCSGALVSDRHVVTAGHCVGIGAAKMVEPVQISVILGDHSMHNQDRHERKHSVSARCRSRDFDKTDEVPRHHDWVLLTLAEPVKFSDHIQPACFATSKTQISESTCSVLGAGIVKKSDVFAKKANYVQRLPVQRASCKNWTKVAAGNFCWTKRGGNGDTCDGDSGGPILCLDKRQKLWHLVGTTSYGSDDCDGSSAQGWVGVYTNIGYHRDDIRKDCKV